MKRPVVLSFLSILALASLGCEPRQNATLCLFSATEEGANAPDSFDCQVDPFSEETEPTTPEERTLVRCSALPVGEGSAYFLRHDLPPGLVSIGELKIHMETPCDAEERDLGATHVNSRVLLSFLPPRGASCAFLLTATMAQSELSCDVVRPAPTGPDDVDPCADLVNLCADNSPPE